MILKEVERCQSRLRMSQKGLHMEGFDQRGAMKCCSV